MLILQNYPGNMTKGKLILIPATLGDNEPAVTLPAAVFQHIDKLNYFVVENTRTARRFLRKCGYKKDFEEVFFTELNEHTPPAEVEAMIKPALQGFDLGIISEAGLPCVADPGSRLVRIAHQKGITVVPLTGPSSIMLALMASGLNGQEFIFRGYLPVKPAERTKALKQIEGEMFRNGFTQIFIETPYRNDSMLQSIVECCSGNTLLCIAADLTLDTEFVATKSVSEWKKQKPDIGKRPAVFLLGKEM